MQAARQRDNVRGGAGSKKKGEKREPQATMDARRPWPRDPAKEGRNEFLDSRKRARGGRNTGP